jgi:sugar lactone lactonase YvrE
MHIESRQRLDVTGRFFEGPRWRDGRWWVSDMSAGTVLSISPKGEVQQELALKDRPSGLGWLPDGTLIVVAMDSKCLYRRQTNGRTTLHADLSDLCNVRGHVNDMVITPDGHIYVGFDPDFVEHSFTSEHGAILHVTPDGRATVAARGLHFPNGMVVTRDRSMLIVAETGTPRLTAFAIGAGGALSDRAVWAEVRLPASAQGKWGDIGLDGCTFDAEGCIWVANANSSDCLRVRPGGEIVATVRIPGNYRCLACALGGDDGKTLLMCGLDLGPAEDLEHSVSHLFTIPLA